jgi:hypothetical protein
VIEEQRDMQRAELVERRLLFDGYMKLRRFRLRYGREERTLDVLSGPGHDVSLVAAFTLDGDGRLNAVLKGGDTRPPRTLRGEPYVKIGTIGGRLDHTDHDAMEIAAAEIAEEIGAELIDGSLHPLGEVPSPTMPDESTEADRYFFALVSFTDRTAAGDGDGLELPGLLHAVTMPIDEAMASIDSGRIGEAARARVAYSRALSRIGYSLALGGFVEDPRWDTLGLGPRIDPRPFARSPGAPPPPSLSLGGMAMTVHKEISLREGLRMMEARASHLAIEGTRVGRPFTMQFLSIPYDRAKVVVWARGEDGAPLVRLDPRMRWQLLVKRDLVPLEVRSHAIVPEARDVLDAKVHPKTPEVTLERLLRARGLDPSRLVRLGGPSDASPGQTDLRHHLFALEVESAVGMMPLSEALRAMREGEGDAASEAALLRLADHIGWIPELYRFADDVVSSSRVEAADEVVRIGEDPDLGRRARGGEIHPGQDRAD